MSNIDYVKQAEKIIIDQIQFSNDCDGLRSDLAGSNTLKCEYYYECIRNIQTVSICNEKYTDGYRKLYWDKHDSYYIWFVNVNHMFERGVGGRLYNYKLPDDFKINISNILELACFI